MKILLFWTLIIMGELVQLSGWMVAKSFSERAEIKKSQLVIPSVYDFFPGS
jgi:hypothetical protein